MLTTRHKCDNCGELNNAYWSDLNDEQYQQIDCDCGCYLEVELKVTVTHQSKPETEQEKYESHKFDSRSR